ncbi:MAG: histidine kinase N-terminal 7TM domain-containing protein [Anaerolineales bacterium]
MQTPLQVFNQILNAGNAITAFSLLLYALTFNLRERVARSLALMFACVTLVYFFDVLVGTSTSPEEVELWLRLQWVGISFIPAAYLHFSDALLASTGRPSRGRRQKAIWVSYILGGVTLVLVAFTDLICGEIILTDSVAYLNPGPLFPVFTLFLVTTVIVALLNFWRAYQRCLTRSTKRRMRYLMAGSLGPLLGSYPFMMAGGGALAQYPLVFWSALILINVLVGAQMILMAYSVAYFGVDYPDRVVKSRLFQWILRGPVVASTVLAVMVVVARVGDLLGVQTNRLVPFTTVAVLLVLQFLITLARQPIERWLFYGEERGDVIRLQLLEERLLTTGDLRQFLESILNAACDIIGVGSAFVAIVGPGGLELEVAVGPEDPMRGSKELPPLLITDELQTFEQLGVVFKWDVYWLLPLRLADPPEVIGIFGIRGRASDPDFSQEEEEQLQALLERATIALAEKKLQLEVFAVVDNLMPRVATVQRMRAEARYASSDALTAPIEGIGSEDELANLVREALGHYWGGPRLTSSPLLSLRVVRQAAVEHEGNPVNALRSILRRGIDQVRPEGERRFTADWMLYNILEMKFLQGRKVRDIAMRLAMSEADLYRKQRVAIEAVTNAVTDMEREAVANEEVKNSENKV